MTPDTTAAGKPVKEPVKMLARHRLETHHKLADGTSVERKGRVWVPVNKAPAPVPAALDLRGRSVAKIVTVPADEFIANVREGADGVTGLPPASDLRIFAENNTFDNAGPQTPDDDEAFETPITFTSDEWDTVCADAFVQREHPRFIIEAHLAGWIAQRALDPKVAKMRELAAKFREENPT